MELILENPANEAFYPVKNNLVDKPAKKHELWIINKKVYDLTSFYDSHPGGDYILKLTRGRDCSELFYACHITTKKNIESMLKTYYVRDAEPELCESQFNWDNKPVYDDLKLRLSAWKKESPDNKFKVTNLGIINYVILFLLGLVTYYYWFLGEWWTLPFLAFWGYFFSGEILHSASHYSVSKKAWVNEWLLVLGYYHCLPLTWLHQHVITHHGHTNVQGKDPDIDHFRSNLNLKIGWRTHEGQTWKNHFSKWWKSLPIIMPLASWGPLILRPFYSFKTGTFMKVTEFKYTSNFEKVAFKLELLITLLVPLFMVYNLGLVKGLLFCAIPRILHGINYYMFSQVNHINTEAFKYVNNPELYAKYNPNKEWAVHQVLSSVDYDTQSALVNYLSVGLNNQVTHHLVPTAHPTRFIKLSPVIRELCKAHNIPYTCYSSYFEALKEHFKYLARVNKKID